MLACVAELRGWLRDCSDGDPNHMCVACPDGKTSAKAATACTDKEKTLVEFLQDW